MSKISNTEKPEELKNNETPETLGNNNNNQKQQTEKGPDQGQGLDNQKQTMFIMNPMGDQGEKQEQKKGILGKIWNALEQIPIIGLLFKAIGAVFNALFGKGQSRDNSNDQRQSHDQQSPQIVIVREPGLGQAHGHNQETGRGGEIKEKQEGPNREGIDAGKEAPGMNLQKLDPQEVKKAAEGLRDWVKHEVGGQSIGAASKATPDQTPVQQDIDGASKGKGM